MTTIARLTDIGDYCDCCLARRRAKYQRVVKYLPLANDSTWEERIQYLCGIHAKHPRLPWFIQSDPDSRGYQPSRKELAGPITPIEQGR